MKNKLIIEGTFTRIHLGSVTESTPIPTGWFIISHRLIGDTKDVRQHYGKWHTIKNEKNRRIYRILRFSPTLRGSKRNDNLKEIALDWIGWIDLCDRDEDVDIELKLKISKSTFWQRIFCVGFKHPEPAYRLAHLLAIVSIGLGLLAILFAFLLRH